MLGEEAVRYEEINMELTGEQVREQSATLFPSEMQAREIVVVGPCPRCRHVTRYVDPLDHLRSRPHLAVHSRRITVLCRCGQGHPDPLRPDSTHSSCGAAYSLEISWGSS